MTTRKTKKAPKKKTKAKAAWMWPACSRRACMNERCYVFSTKRAATQAGGEVVRVRITIEEP